MKTVLVIDDDIVSRKVMKNVCESLGYRVVECDNGEKGWRVLKKQKVDIVISDWIMPALDGLSLCERIRDEERPDKPFVFMITGKKKGLGDFAHARDAGADDFVYKPVDYYVFRNQLRAAEEALCKAEPKLS